MMTWPDWPEEVEIAANKEISEEIQAGTSVGIRRISERCEDEAAVSVRSPKRFKWRERLEGNVKKSWQER